MTAPAAQQALDLGGAPISPGERFRIAQLDAIEWLSALPSGSVDLVVTDPAYESLEKHRAKGTTTRLKVSEGSSNQWFPIFPNTRFSTLFAAVYRALKRDSHFYMMCDQETAFFAKPLAEAVGFKFWKAIVWDKVTIGMGYHYRARHEFVMFFEKGKRKLNDLGYADVLSVPRVRGLQCTKCGVSLRCDDQEVQGRSTQKATSRSTLGAGASSSLTSSNGSDTTDQSHPGCRSTTRMRTSKTTLSETSRSSMPQHTSESTADANCETEFGGSLAAAAKHSSRSPLSTGISTRMGDGQSSDAVDRATSRTLSGASSSSACSRCGSPRRSFYPTEKPVELSEILIGQSSSPGEIVADPFMGSGSIGVAALQQGRRFLGCDIADDSILVAEPRLERAAEP